MNALRKLVASVLLGQLESAELDQRASSCLGRCQAGAQVFPGLLIEVEPHLLIEPAFELLSSPERTDPAPALHHPAHHGSPSSLSQQIRKCLAPRIDYGGGPRQRSGPLHIR
jgi:hypothetical protein